MRATITTLAVALGLIGAAPVGATTGKGQLFHDGSIVGTVVTPSPIPAGTGTDPFYKVTNGAEGQLGIAGVAQCRATPQVRARNSSSPAGSLNSSNTVSKSASSPA